MSPYWRAAGVVGQSPRPRRVRGAGRGVTPRSLGLRSGTFSAGCSKRRMVAPTVPTVIGASGSKDRPRFRARSNKVVTCRAVAGRCSGGGSIGTLISFTTSTVRGGASALSRQARAEKRNRSASAFAWAMTLCASRASTPPSLAKRSRPRCSFSAARAARRSSRRAARRPFARGGSGESGGFGSLIAAHRSLWIVGARHGCGVVGLIVGK